MRLVVLTGGIATGKSTVGAMLIKHGIPVLDSDQISHDVELPNGPAFKRIVELFGTDVVDNDGFLDRKKIGQIVFKFSEKRKALNRIVHPYVIRELIKKTLIHWFEGKRIIVIDAPLFFEGTLPKCIFNDIVTVSCSPQIEFERLKKRNGFSDLEAIQRINSQMPLSEKCSRSTHVINNDGDINALQIQVDSLVKQWKQTSTPFYMYPSPIIFIGLILLLLILIFALLKKLI